MTVDQLRGTLTQLAELLRASDAKAGTVRDLTEFVEGTAAFGDLTLKSFVKFAEAGQAPPKPTATPRRQTTPKVIVDPVALAAEVKGLYDRVADPSVTEEQVREVCGRLGPLKKDALVRVAEGIELVGMQSRKKDDIIAEITHRLVDRKGAAVRRQLIDRPPN